MAAPSKKKIISIKLFNAVKVKHEILFADDKLYEITLEGNMIKIVDRATKDSCYTTLFNTCWLKVDE